MKKREDGFLGTDRIDHDSEIFDYIKEQNRYLWKFVRLVFPRAGGHIEDFVDDALEMGGLRIQNKNDVVKKFMDDKEMKHMKLMEKWLDVYRGEKE